MRHAGQTTGTFTCDIRVKSEPTQHVYRSTRNRSKSAFHQAIPREMRRRPNKDDRALI